MPQAKDITSDLGKLRKHKVMPTGVAPVMPQTYKLERKPAFNGSGFLFWMLIGSFLVMQVLFLGWLAK